MNNCTFYHQAVMPSTYLYGIPVLVQVKILVKFIPEKINAGQVMIPIVDFSKVHENGLIGYLLPDLAISEGALIIPANDVNTTSGIRIEWRGLVVYLYPKNDQWHVWYAD